MASKAQLAFARQVYAAAVEAKTEIDPAFVTAQAMLETGWGARVIGKANLFGITKGSQWDGDIVMVKTHEYFKTSKQKFKEPDRIVSVCKVAGKNLWYYTVMRAFKDFDSVGDCLKEHERLFQKSGYKDAWPYRKDPFKFAQKICDGVGCKYATDPTYLTTITSIIKTIQRKCV
ncbi:glycoside hydrolase family 73 protein [Segatella copri]|jgi:flagellum-specific peptidoglycan hydrolase FlgJ|uniref:Mannosyl-glycoprotein endo-beta-N-acetylglucosamidase n=1 Tax=Segatella copri TaxID=165179 RepID=A0AA92U5F2_9BACT|nr:glucosaminidase domain-containing protein [Segatella copri]RGW67899.1 mannosyl-glycoprotein endo-beta-N-acetylglucosamidase [Segatella copri]